MEKLFIKALRALIKSIRDMKGNSPSANTKQVANVMVYLLQQLETFVNTIIGSATIGGRRWFLPKMENRLVSSIVAATNDETVTTDRVKKIIRKLQAVLLDCLDVVSVVCMFVTRSGCMYRCFMQGDIKSSNFFSDMLATNPSWSRIVKRIVRKQKNVRVTIAESHQNTPTECIILIQYLYQLLKTFDLNITSVEIALARRAVGSRKVKLGAEQRFQNTKDKVWFLKMMMQKVLGVPVTVTCVEKLEEYHNITLQNKNFTLKILTTDGISYWWRGRIAKKIPDMDKLKDFPFLGMELKNIATSVNSLKGIGYVVWYSPKGNTGADLPDNFNV